MDYLLTWNCSHLANANKKKHLRRLNERLLIVIHTERGNHLRIISARPASRKERKQYEKAKS